MKKIQLLALILMSMLLGYSSSLHAEDTDIYVSNSVNVGVPNVLFVLYNGADVDADAGTSCTYADGTTPSTGGSKVISLLQCSLVNAIAGLTSGSVNIGIAVSNANGLGSSQATTDTTRGGYHDLCNSSGAGGCIIRKLMNMDTAGKASMTRVHQGTHPVQRRQDGRQRHQPQGQHYFGGSCRRDAGGLGLLQRQDGPVRHELFVINTGQWLPAQFHRLHRHECQVGLHERRQRRHNRVAGRRLRRAADRHHGDREVQPEHLRQARLTLRDRKRLGR